MRYTQVYRCIHNGSGPSNDKSMKVSDVGMNRNLGGWVGGSCIGQSNLGRIRSSNSLLFVRNVTSFVCTWPFL